MDVDEAFAVANKDPYEFQSVFYSRASNNSIKTDVQSTQKLIHKLLGTFHMFMHHIRPV